MTIYLTTGTCPGDFIKSEELSSCYAIFTDASSARSVPDARNYCQSLHPLSDLVSIETDEEQTFMRTLLKNSEREYLCLVYKTDMRN